jgi:hypothetical protein
MTYYKGLERISNTKQCYKLHLHNIYTLPTSHLQRIGRKFYLEGAGRHWALVTTWGGSSGRCWARTQGTGRCQSVHLQCGRRRGSLDSTELGGEVAGSDTVERGWRRGFGGEVTGLTARSGNDHQRERRRPSFFIMQGMSREQGRRKQKTSQMF